MLLNEIAYTYDCDEYKKWLSKETVSERTIETRLEYIRRFFTKAEQLTQESYREYIEEMVEDGKRNTTINLAINTINSYLRFLVSQGHEECKEWVQSSKRVIKQQYLEDVLSMADYEFLLKKAEILGEWRIYLYARIAGTTGMRLCEMIQIKREHIEHGCVDIYGKGAKRRRIYFAITMREKILEILDKVGLKSGYIFSPYFNGLTKIVPSAIQHQLSDFAIEECELPKGLVHAHGFRHFFAKEFIKKYQNIALLADLLGHNDIETTRIYLKYTSQEQADIINEFVTW